MASSTGAISVLMNRLIVFIFLFVSLIVLATNKLTTSLFSEDNSSIKYTFKDFYAYRYLLSVAVIGCAYTLLQIPFAALNVSKGNSLDQISQLVIFTDLVFTSLFATGVGAGFGLTVDTKSSIHKSFRNSGLQDDPEVKDVDKFFDLVHVSTGFLLMATTCMLVITIISMHALTRK